VPREELLGRLQKAQADPGLRQDLARLAGDTTDDLGDLEWRAREAGSSQAFGVSVLVSNTCSG
jgi:hypothetical protein